MHVFLFAGIKAGLIQSWLPSYGKAPSPSSCTTPTVSQTWPNPYVPPTLCS